MMNGATSFTTAAVLGCVIYIGTSFAGWVAGAVAIMSFFSLGGWKTTKLAIKTLPRDIK